MTQMLWHATMKKVPYFIPAGGRAVDTACPVASWVLLLPSVKINKSLSFPLLQHQSIKEFNFGFCRSINITV